MATLPIVGARFRPPAQEVLDNLPAGAKLLLRRQPDNPYDGNAVQVMLNFDAVADLPDSTRVSHVLIDHEKLPQDFPLHLGFIPREAAAKLAPVMDQWARDNGIEEEGTFAIEEAEAEWPATLTFSTSGGPCVSFEVPNVGS